MIELITFLHAYFPDVLCLTEHQLKQTQLKLTYLDNYHMVLDIADKTEGMAQ
jgi:exonuclease III